MTENPTAPLGIALLALASACELPTSVPRVDQHWIVPAQSTTISVASLLPAGIVINDSVFHFGINPPLSVTRTLAQDCAGCTAANGTTVPKPAFTATATASSAVPAGIVSATLLAGGALQVSLNNSYNFDPLRPSAAARGYVVLTVTNAGATLGRDSVNGAAFAFPPGGAFARAVALTGTVTASAPVLVQLTLFSPAGDPVLMDASRAVLMTANVTGISVASASVSVTNQPVSSTTTLDLSDIDESVTKRVDAGALQLDVENPFNVAGTLTVQFTSVGLPTIIKSLSLVAGTSHPTISFTQTEIQQLLGHSVTLTISGPVSSTGGAVAVSPKQAVVVTTRLDISLHTGG